MGKISVTSVTVNPVTLKLELGGCAFVTAMVCPANATYPSVVWTSSNNDVASVNPTSGLVTAKAAGNAIIKATATDGSGFCGTCILTVPSAKPILSKGEEEHKRSFLDSVQNAPGVSVRFVRFNDSINSNEGSAGRGWILSFGLSRRRKDA